MRIVRTIPTFMYWTIAVTIAIMFFIFSSFGVDADEITNSYYNSFAISTITETNAVIEDSDTFVGEVDSREWLDIVDTAHRYWGGTLGLTYNQSVFHDIRDTQGNIVKIRPDCTGFVQYCMYEYGIYDTPSVGYSGTDYSQYGCEKVDGINSLNDLQRGDIVVWRNPSTNKGHAAIYAGENGSNEFWDYGSDSKGKNKYLNVDISTAPNLSSNTRTIPPASGIVTIYRVPPRASQDVPPAVDGIVAPTDWLETLDAVHKLWGGSGLHYGLGHTATITGLDGNRVTIRRDCSGYVGYALYCMGWANSPIPCNSQTDFTAFGFNKINGCSSVSDLVAGDILAWPGSHVQVYAGNNSWYNWGGSDSAENKYAGVTNVSTVDSKSYRFSHSVSAARVYRRSS